MDAARTMRPSVLYRRHEIIGDDDYFASAMYHETIRPLGQCEFVLAMLARTRHCVVPFTVYRRLDSGQFDGAEVAFLRRLLPHLSRCVQIQLRLGTAEAENRELGAALDRLPLCVMLLDDRAKLLRANPAAEALLWEGDGLAVMGGRVVAPDRRAASRFRNLLAAAAAAGSGRGHDDGGRLRCRDARQRDRWPSLSPHCRALPSPTAAAPPALQFSCSPGSRIDRPE